MLNWVKNGSARELLLFLQLKNKNNLSTGLVFRLSLQIASGPTGAGVGGGKVKRRL